MNQRCKQQWVMKKQKIEEKEKGELLNVRHEQKRGEKQWVEKLQHNKRTNMDEASSLEMEQLRGLVVELSTELEEERNKMQNFMLWLQWKDEVEQLSGEVDQLKSEVSGLLIVLEKERDEMASIKSWVEFRKLNELEPFLLPNGSSSTTSIH